MDERLGNNKDKYNILNMDSTFLYPILPASQARDPNIDNSDLAKRIQQVYQSSLEKLTEKASNQSVINQFRHYCQQLKALITQHSTTSLLTPIPADSSPVQTFSDKSPLTQQSVPAIQQQHSDYIFLRNLWHSKYDSTQNYDPEDHIDRINKVVAMVRMRTNFMIKKQTYLYDKEEFTNSFLTQNPLFLKIKEELQKITMKNQELSQRCHFQAETIVRLQTEKSTLLENFTNIKKKLQQTEKSLVEVSKKNVCLEQDSLALKSQSSKNKLNSMRESTDFSGFMNIDLSRSTNFSRFAEEAKNTERSTEASQCTIKQSLPLENVFVDISLNMKSSREPAKEPPKSSNSRYMNNESENEENNSVNIGRERVNSINQNLPILALCRSERLITEEAPMRLKYIRSNNNDNGSARKTLLSSARSVDLADKTSLNKPKFERTKPSYQNLLKSVKKDDCAILEPKTQKPSLLKKNTLMNEGLPSNQLFREIREHIISREELN